MTPAQIQDLTIELLQKCFQDCIYCSSNSSDDQETQIPIEKVFEIIDDFKELGGRTIELSGGEPLAYKHIHEVIKYLKSKQIDIHLFTCCYIPEGVINWEIIELVDRIYVNLQAPNAEIHDYLTRTPGSFERVIQFITKCKSLGKWVGTHIIPLPHNINEIDDYVILASELGVDNISLLRFVVQGRGAEKLQLNQEEILQLHDIIQKYYGKIDNMEFKIGCPLDFQFIFQRRKKANPCKSGIGRCVIRPNGNVIPCPAFKDSPEQVAGNIFEKSLKEIWEFSELFQSLRNFEINNLKGQCKDCSFLNVCKGRCHAQRIHSYGDILQGPDPYCPIKRK